VEASIPEEGTGQLDHAQEVLVLLVVADEDRPTLRNYPKTPFDPTETREKQGVRAVLG
jgi:hypothetical protein